MHDDNLKGFIGLLNRLWDGREFDRDRLTTKSARIKGRRLSVSMMMQPIVLARLLDARGGVSRGMGFVARSLMTMPASTIGTRFYRDAPDRMPALAKLHRRVRALRGKKLPTNGPNMTLRPPPLGLSVSAFQVWRSLHDEIEGTLSRTGEFGDIPDIGAKIAENAARIAGVFHVIEQGPGGAIDAATMEGAAAVAVWHPNEARRIIGAKEKSQNVLDADLLVEWLLRQPGPVAPRDILNRGPSPCSSVPISREYPATSAARIAARRRVWFIASSQTQARQIKLAVLRVSKLGSRRYDNRGQRPQLGDNISRFVDPPHMREAGREKLIRQR
jgi:hypothetical protein